MQSLQAAFGLHQAGHLRQAETIYRRILQTSPDHPDALHLLGLMARQEGDHESAVELISRAAHINPVAPVYFNLGNAYQSLDRLEDAADSFRRAVALNPEYVSALNNLGIVLQQQGQMEAAINCFREALQLQPGYAELYSNLGDALRENRQFEIALECIQQAIQLKPDFFNAHLNLGKVFHDLGQSKEALASFQHALSLNPNHAETHLAMAGTYSAEGKFEAVGEHIDKALQLAPDNPEAWASIAFSKKLTLEDKAWAEKALSFLKTRLKPRVEIHLNYALGKYYDDTHQYESAFPHYSRANQSQKCLNEAFDRASHRNLVDSIISANTPERMQRQIEGGNPSHRPVFIVGMPRSGTSLMEQILASHPDVFGAGELRFWSLEANRYFPDMSAWYDDARQLREISSRYETEISQHSSSASRVVDKMPANFLNLGMIHAAFPSARIIHMQRNPADTCLSIYFQGFSEHHAYSNDLDDLAFYYREYRRLMNHWREVLPPGIFLDVPYEGLVEDQENWSRHVVSFLGLEWNDSCLNFHETNRRVGTASNWQVRQKIYKTSKARWLNYQDFIGPLLPLIQETGN
jgi:tetratricopeptide (TPR) repeat protein